MVYVGRVLEIPDDVLHVYGESGLVEIEEAVPDE